MQSLLIILFLLHKATFKTLEVEKVKYCGNLKCLDIGESVCGFRTEGDGFRIKLFENECELLKYGCEVDEDRAYGLINKEYCQQPSADFNGISNYPDIRGDKLNSVLFYEKSRYKIPCKQYQCIDNYEVCGIREDGTGYRVRLFDSKCKMEEYNCDNDVQFKETDNFICKSDVYNKTNDNETIDNVYKNITNLVVVGSNILGDYDNINDSIDSFFAASHVFDLPVKEVETLNTRRRWLKYAGPINVFVPWIVKPKNISNDSFNIPTLSSCYHRCPTKCPDTYAPVCGVPGIVAREPSIMFQNHCFMDVAQCKMFWENRSSTAQSSSYLEASFLFCMGDEMNAVYRFLPAIRTLQHMGRLKKKGKFRAKLRNFRFLSEFRSGRPKFMG